jgi:hypothetical protein
MKSFKYKHLLLTSLFSMILIYAFTMIYINKNFDFQLAETTFFLSVPKFIEIARLFTYSQVQAYIIQATSIDVIWPISYCLFKTGIMWPPKFILFVVISPNKSIFVALNIPVVIPAADKSILDSHISPSTYLNVLLPDISIPDPYVCA